MNEEEKFKEAIKELKDSHELHQQEWAKRCLDMIVDLYNQEKQKNKKLEEVTKLMASDMERLGSTDELIEYYFKKARGEDNEYENRD